MRIGQQKPRRGVPLFIFGVVALLALMVLTSAPPTSAQQDSGKRVPASEEAARKKALEQDRPGPNAEAVGSEACEMCHEEVVKVFSASRHTIHLRKVLKEANQACEHCHGPGSEHVDSGDGTKILRFPPRSSVTVKRAAEICIKCHATTHDSPHWRTNVHATADVGCVDCHRFHGSDDDPFMLQKPIVKVSNLAGFRYDANHPTTSQAINGTCLNCHAAQAAQARLRSHHPMLEDRVSCTDCHEVHRSTNPALMPVNKSMSAVCTKCHTNIRGPFVYEHEPTRTGGLGESCLTCHQPHGSPNQKLLITNSHDMCIQCHTDINTDDAHQGRPGSCWRSGCHTDIHGSNKSQLFFR